MEDKVKEIISEISGIPVEDINADTRLAGDLAMSSFDLADAVVTFEEEYGVHIPDERFSEIETVGDILRIIQEVEKQ